MFENVLIYLGINFYLTANFEYFKNHLITSSLIAGVISFLNGLYFNRKWTFKSDRHWVRDTIYILSIFGFCTFVQNSVYAAMIIYLKSLNIFPEKQNLFYALCCGMVVFAVLNFGLNKYVTFRTKKTTAEEEDIIQLN